MEPNRSHVNRAAFNHDGISKTVVEAAGRLHTLSLIGLVLLLGLIDYFTGTGISFSLLYLVPITLAAWFRGLRSGIILAVVGAAVWFASEYASKDFTYPFVPYWNAGMRLGVFLLMVLLLTKIRKYQQDLAAKTHSLTLEITERQRAEEALRESELLFRLITENVADLIMVIDTQGRRLYCNPACRLNGIDPANSDFFEEILCEDRERLRLVFQTTVDTGTGQWADYRVRAPDGTICYLESHWTVIRESGQEPGNVVVVSRNVTERRRSEKGYRDERQILEMIARGKPLPEILNTLAERVENWIENVSCSIHAAASPWTKPRGATPLKSSFAAPPPSLAGSPDETIDDPALAELCGHIRKESRAAVEFRPIVSTTGEALGVMAIRPRQEGLVNLKENHSFEKAAHIAAIAMERRRVEEALRQISKLVIDAQEAERSRVARELHDGVNQLLSSVAFRVEAIQAKLPGDGTLPEEAQRMKFLLNKAIQEVRKISNNLLPSELDALGLLAAVRGLCDEIMERTPLEIELSSHRLPERLEPELELTLFRIIQESLRNIEKHAQASRAAISLTVKGAFLHLRIHDNGCGFSNSGASADRPREGMGLVNIRERAAFAGGIAVVRSSAKAGTEITVRLPRRRRQEMNEEPNTTYETENQSSSCG
jgi:PAS domain S-box-containing protein